MARIYLIVLLFIAILTVNRGQAQSLIDSRTSSHYTFVYKINNDQAKDLYRSIWNLENSFLTNLQDFYPTDSVYHKILPLGHYVFVSARGADLHVELKSINNLDLNVLNNRRDLILVLHDSLGKEISDADVNIKRTGISFDSKTKSYRLAKSNKQGLISADYRGHTSFFEIERQRNNGVLIRTGRKIRQSVALQVVFSPVIYLKNIVANLIRGYGFHSPPFFPKNKRGAEGYIVFNKPEYKPGDTVKLKAFITTSEGKPNKKAATIHLHQYYGERFSRKIATIYPFRPGAYKYEFKLDDSLKMLLDKNYTVEFRNTKGRRLLSNSFHYEDYELKNNTYSLRANDAQDGPYSTLYLKGTDSNDMPLYDVRAEILVTPASVDIYYSDKLFVKDTLWFYQTKLEPIGETKITIPDSIMPNAKIEYQAKVSFLNSENERTVKEIRLSSDKQELPVSFSIKEDSLVITPRSIGKSNTKFKLEAYDRGKLILKEIDLPYREKVNYFVHEYVVCGNGLKKSFFVNRESDLLQFRTRRTKDSLSIATDNPRHLSFRYFLFRNQQLVDYGESENLSIMKKCNTNDSYTLNIQYVWSGLNMSKEIDLPFEKQELNISLDHAPMVYPGENTSFTISVKDTFGEPVENVDVTAYATTKKFSSHREVTVPNLGRPKKRRITLHEFEKTTLRTSLSRRLEISYWRKILGLDSITFYKFMFPENGYFEDRSSSTITQFAPFVMGYGIESIAVILVDDQPVFFSGAGHEQPYSFSIKPGTHTIKLRVRDALLTINNVKIDAAQKLIFSLNKFNLPKNCTSVKMPNKLTNEELSRLSRHFVEVRWNANRSNAYIQQDDRFFLSGNNNIYQHSSNELVGPFYPGKATYAEKHGFTMTYEHEPFKTYEFSENKMTLRDLNTRDWLKRRPIYWYSSRTRSFTDNVLTKQSIETTWKRRPGVRASARERLPKFEERSSSVGKLTLDYIDRNVDRYYSKIAVIINAANPHEYYIFYDGVKSQPFNAGQYQVVIIVPGEQYLKVDSIEISPFGTTYYNLKNQKTRDADSLSAEVVRLIEQSSSQNNNEQTARFQKTGTLQYDGAANYSFTHQVTGRVTDNGGEGIQGVNVMVKGVPVGTVTDANGNYSLKVPPYGELAFTFIGYQAKDESVNNRAIVNVSMIEDVQRLQEVAIIRTPRYRHGANYRSRSDEALIGYSVAPSAASSIKLRGTAGVNQNNEPLVILDGRIVRLSEVDSHLITMTDVIKGADAIAIYGEQGANGVILLSTKPGATKTYLHEMSRGLLLTAALENIPGSTLRKNFRDYAFWQPSLTTDENGKAVFRVTFPDDITGWNAHVLAMGSKKRTGQMSSGIRSYKPLVAQVAQPHFLVEDDRAIALGKITNYGPEQVQLTKSIKVNDQLIKNEIVAVQNSSIDSISLTTSGLDSVSVEYLATFKTYKDGELRKIPVMKKGTREATGQFLALNSDTTFTLHVSDNKQTTKLYASADLLDVFLDEIRYLKHYSYDCNEQLASKLKALLLEKEISMFNKSKFTDEKEIHRIVKKLTRNQNFNGSWGWWNNDQGEVWITMHVINSLLRAEMAGYQSPINKELLIDYFERELSSLSTSNKLNVLIFLSGQRQTLKVQDLIDSIKTSTTSTIHEKLLAERLSQSLGNKVDWTWLNAMRSKTIKGNYYWGDDKPSVYDNSVLTTLLVYQMAIRENTNSDVVRKIENYFLEQRHKHWRNTYESSSILEQMLPQMVNKTKSAYTPQLQVSNSDISKTINSFPFEMSVNANDLTVTKTGNSPIYFTTYAEQWNTAPAQSKKDFVIRTSFDNAPNSLVGGKPVKLNIELEVKNDAEYVMIEVPVPAGCSYTTKSQSHINGEVHREYFNHKTTIFAKYLKKGNYSYAIELLPRYSGTYTLNPAVVECMYFPTLFGRAALREVSIK